MKIVTWNVRGVCSPSTKFCMWKNVFEGQWDILCAVEHMDHAKSGSFIQHNMYHVCYASVDGGLYSVVILIVKDTLEPMVVQSDIHGRSIVVEVNYEGQRIWIVGILCTK